MRKTILAIGLFAALAHAERVTVTVIHMAPLPGTDNRLHYQLYFESGNNAPFSNVFAAGSSSALAAALKIQVIIDAATQGVITTEPEIIIQSGPWTWGTVNPWAWGSIPGTLSNQTDLNTALGLKAPLASPTFTGTIGGITAAMVGLGNVTNTSDANKPVSTAQQAALNLKADLASPALTGTPAAPTAADGTDTTQLATTAYVERRDRSAAIVADLAIANTEAVVVSKTFAANELAAGATYMYEAYATRAGTTSASPVVRIRVGTTILSGNIAATLTGTASTLAVGTKISGMVTIRTAGSGGTVLGSLNLATHLAAVTITQSISPSTATVAVNTTTPSQVIGLTFISGNAANTFTFRNAAMWRVN